MKIPHPAPLSGAEYSAVELAPDDRQVLLLDQRLLPETEHYVFLESASAVSEAIADMLVRGAPAIGIAAAYGMVLAAHGDAARAEARLRDAAQTLVRARPTAVNLAWAVEQMLARAERIGFGARGLVPGLALYAREIHRQDVEACRMMGKLALPFIGEGATILTHCNAGALATGGYGTALGVVRAAHEAGRGVRVLADETRPYLQGARLTAWELSRSGIPVEVLPDSAAAHYLSRGEVTLIVVGADRIAANGDVANKIGTYGLACLAKHHGVPFYVAAPWSTVDLRCPGGNEIVIEERAARELTHVNGQRTVPQGVRVRNPAFDVTPAALVTAIFTERGTAAPASHEAIARLAP